MPKLFFALLLFAPILAVSQSDTTKASIYTTQIKDCGGGSGCFEFVSVATGTKEELFTKALQAVSRMFVGGRGSLAVQDNKQCLIEFKGMTADYFARQAMLNRTIGHFTYKATIQTKDGRYRVLFTDIKYENSGELMLKSGADITEDYPANWNKKFTYTNSANWWKAMQSAALSEFRYTTQQIDDALNEKAVEASSKW